MMWFAQLRLLIYWFVFCGLLKDKCPLANSVVTKGVSLEIKDKYGNPSRHYIEGGTATGICPFENGAAKVTVDGAKATAVSRENISDPFGRIISQRINIHLNRSTVLGNYMCHGNNDFKLHRIGYILCDQSKMLPAKLCPKDHFCVINGADTLCQTKLGCEGVDNPIECQDRTIANSHNKSCSIYNDAQKKIQAGYYLDISTNKDVRCKANLQILHKGEAIKFLSIVPISSSSELKNITWSGTPSNAAGVSCYRITPTGTKYNMTFSGSDFTTAWHGGSPVKAIITCKAYKSTGVGRSEGYTRFYILFYGRNRTQFNIVQGTTIVNITDNTKDKVVHLRPKIPFTCTVKTEEGLLIEALQSEGESRKKGENGQDSVDMGSKEVSKGKYTCIAKVYYYEQFGDIGFKLLYEEKRDVIINITAEATAATTTIATTPTQAPKGGGKKGSNKTVTIVVAILVTLVILGVIAGVIVYMYLKGRKQKSEPRVKPVERGREKITETTSTMQPDSGTSWTQARTIFEGRPGGRKIPIEAFDQGNPAKYQKDAIPRYALHIIQMAKEKAQPSAAQPDVKDIFPQRQGSHRSGTRRIGSIDHTRKGSGPSESTIDAEHQDSEKE